MTNARLLHDPEHLPALMDLLTRSISADLRGDAMQALALTEQALELAPRFAPALMRRGDLLLARAQFDEAIATYEECLRAFPVLEDARRARQQALSQAVTWGAAELGRHDGDVVQWCRQARWQIALEHHADALESLDQALQLAPDDIAAWNLRGNALVQLRQYEPALQCYAHVLALSEQDPLALFNRANLLQKMGQPDAACAGFTQALAQRPQFAEAELGLAHVLLLQEKYAQGWRHHEARWRTEQLRGHQLFTELPLWLGAPLPAGAAILLWAEQGLGDSVQFARFIPAVARLAQRVTVCVPPGLQRLLGSLAGSNVEIVDDIRAIPPHDFQCPLMSLPLALGAGNDLLAAQVPYLHAESELQQQWSVVLAASAARHAHATTPKIGLAWAGRQYGMRDATRDIPLQALRPLAACAAQWASLQQQIPATDLPELHHWPAMHSYADGLTDMAQTAALVANLDLVISADTAMIHLAAAMGKPAWLMLRAESEWRWGVAGRQSRWYPSVRIFRQHAAGDWSGVAAEVAATLRQWLQEREAEGRALNAPAGKVS